MFNNLCRLFAKVGPGYTLSWFTHGALRATVTSLRALVELDDRRHTRT